MAIGLADTSISTHEDDQIIDQFISEGMFSANNINYNFEIQSTQENLVISGSEVLAEYTINAVNMGSFELLVTFANGEFYLDEEESANLSDEFVLAFLQKLNEKNDLVSNELDEYGLLQQGKFRIDSQKIQEFLTKHSQTKGNKQLQSSIKHWINKWQRGIVPDKATGQPVAIASIGSYHALFHLVKGHLVPLDVIKGSYIINPERYPQLKNTVYYVEA